MQSKLAIIGLLPLALGTGCYIENYDDGPRTRTRYGDLTIRYTFDRANCEQAGVDRIRVDVRGRDYNDGFSDVVRCSEFRFGITIEDLREDRYDLTVEGLSRQGEVLFSNESREVVDVFAGDHREYTVATIGTGGELRVFWTFDGSGACGEVDEVRVTVIDPEGVLFDDARYPCDFEGVEYSSVQDGLWTVSMFALDGTDRIVYEVRSQGVVVIRGADNSYTLDLGLR